MFRWLRDSYGYDMRKVDDLSSLQGKQVLKFSVYHPERCEELCAPYFTPAWRDKVTLAAAGKRMDGQYTAGGRKSTAVEFIQQQLGISPRKPVHSEITSTILPCFRKREGVMR